MKRSWWPWWYGSWIYNCLCNGQMWIRNFYPFRSTRVLVTRIAQSIVFFVVFLSDHC